MERIQRYIISIIKAGSILSKPLNVSPLMILKLRRPVVEFIVCYFSIEISNAFTFI